MRRQQRPHFGVFWAICVCLGVVPPAAAQSSCPPPKACPPPVPYPIPTNQSEYNVSNVNELRCAWDSIMYKTCWRGQDPDERFYIPFIFRITYTTDAIVELDEPLVWGNQTNETQIELGYSDNSALQFRCRDAGTALYIQSTNKNFLRNGAISNCRDSAVVVDDTAFGVLQLTLPLQNPYNFALQDFQLVNNTATRGGAVWIQQGQLACERTAFANNTAEDGAAIYVSAGGSLSSLDACNFSSNRPVGEGRGSAVSLAPGACMRDVLDSVFTGNLGTNGSAVNIQSIPPNCSWWDPVETEFPISITGSTFADNVAQDAGGALWIKQLYPDAGYIAFDRCIFQNNTAGTAGGAVWASVAFMLSVYNSSFLDNTAGVAGGALFFTSNDLGRLVINDTNRVLFKDSEGSTTLSGNRVVLDQPSLGGVASELQPYPWEYNITYGGGGAIAATGELLVQMYNSSFAGNSAALLGGALLCTRCLDVEVRECNLTLNAAGWSGGAIALAVPSGQVIMSGALFTDNTARQGAAIPAVPPSVNLEGLPCSSGGGGGLCLQTLSRNTLLSNTNFTDNAAHVGGAVFVDQSLCSKASLTCDVAAVNASLEGNVVTGPDPGAVFFWAGPTVSLNGNGSAHVCNDTSIGRWLRTWPMELWNISVSNSSVNSVEPFNITGYLRDLCGNPVLVVDREMALSVLAPAEVALASAPAPVGGVGNGSAAGAVLPRVTLSNASLFGQQADYMLHLQIASDGMKLAKGPVTVTIRMCTVGEVEVVNNTLCQSCALGDANSSYSFDPQQYACNACPDFATCPAALVVPMNNYWQSSPRSPQLHICPLPGSCKYITNGTSRYDILLGKQLAFRDAFPYTYQFYEATDPAIIASFNASLYDYESLQCSPGYTGNACGTCAENYGRLRYRCSLCRNAAGSWALYVFFRLIDFGLIACLLMLKLRRRIMNNSLAGAEGELATRLAQGNGAPQETIPTADDKRAAQMQIEIEFARRMERDKAASAVAAANLAANAAVDASVYTNDTAYGMDSALPHDTAPSLDQSSAPLPTWPAARRMDSLDSLGEPLNSALSTDDQELLSPAPLRTGGALPSLAPSQPGAPCPSLVHPPREPSAPSAFGTTAAAFNVLLQPTDSAAAALTGPGPTDRDAGPEAGGLGAAAEAGPGAIDPVLFASGRSLPPPPPPVLPMQAVPGPLRMRSSLSGRRSARWHQRHNLRQAHSLPVSDTLSQVSDDEDGMPPFPPQLRRGTNGSGLRDLTGGRGRRGQEEEEEEEGSEGGVQPSPYLTDTGASSAATEGDGRLGWAVLFRRATTKSKIDAGAMFEALVFYVQMLGLLARVAANYPSFTEGFLNGVDVSSSVSGWTSLECLMGGGGNPAHAYGHVLVSIFIPVLTQLIFQAFWLLYYVSHRHQVLEVRRWFVERSVVTASQVALFYYSSVTASALSLFSCVTLDLEEGPYQDNLLAVGQWWVQNTQVQCLQGSHRTWALALGLPTLLLFSVGAPVASAVFCAVNRQRLQQLQFRERYGMLYENYRIDYYWWNLVQFGRLLALNVAAECFQYFGAAIQVVSFMAILTVAVTVHMAYRPYRRTIVNFVHAVPMYAVLATTYMALSFVDPSTSQAFRTTMGVLVILINVFCVLLILTHVAWAVWPSLVLLTQHASTLTKTLRQGDTRSVRSAVVRLFRHHSLASSERHLQPSEQRPQGPEHA